MFHPAVNGHDVNHQSAGSGQAMDGAKELANVKHMLGSAGVQNDIELLAKINRIIEIDFQRCRRAVKIDGGIFSVVQAGPEKYLRKIPALVRRFVTENCDHALMQFFAQGVVLHQRIDVFRQRLG